VSTIAAIDLDPSPAMVTSNPTPSGVRNVVRSEPYALGARLGA
jgi:hypothetical protein